MKTTSSIPFDSDTRTFSMNNAYWLAQAAQIAYQDKGTIEQAVRDLGMDEFQFLSKDDTEGFIAANDQNIVVAFRGTQPSHLKDLLTDAKIHKVKAPMGNVHRGFLNAFELVMDDTFNAIERMRSGENSQALWLTGHSLGAALASVAVSHLLTDRQDVAGMYNFGQPRAGDDEFAGTFNSKFEDRHFRFVNNNDSVTRVPPREFGYSHTGSLRYIDIDGEIHDDIAYWNRFIDRIQGRAKNRIEHFLSPKSDGLNDHSMEHYLASIHNSLKS